MTERDEKVRRLSMAPGAGDLYTDDERGWLVLAKDYDKLRARVAEETSRADRAEKERDEAIARADYAEAYLRDATTSGGAVRVELERVTAERDSLRAEVARLREALEQLLDGPVNRDAGHHATENLTCRPTRYFEQARTALASQKDGAK